MYKYDNEKQLCFDDILMVPQHSTVMSRREVNLGMYIGTESHLDLPVIASPMDTVCEADMAIAMAKAGGIGIIHRFMSAKKQIELVEQVNSHEGLGLAVGAALSSTFLEDQVARLLKAGATLFLIDTANGHNFLAVEATKRLKDFVGENAHVMSGNVSTSDGFLALAKAGADSVRVGIGGGSVCTTRLVSGHGIPTLASVMSIKQAKGAHGLSTGIIADGGIRTTGDMIKAFAAGADAVMLGSMLSGTDESPGSLYIDETGKYKTFRGMASKEANEGKDIAVAEGVATRVPYKGLVSHILDNIRGGLGSGCSYSGVHNLSDLYGESFYIEVSSLSVSESKPHALN